MVDEKGEPLRGGAAAKYVADCIASAPQDADFYAIAQAGDDKPDICHTGNGPTSASNAAFCAHAREDIPWLVAEVERLREELETALRYAKGEVTPSNIRESDLLWEINMLMHAAGAEAGHANELQAERDALAAKLGETGRLLVLAQTKGADF
jgi:hypothetical protein